MEQDIERVLYSSTDIAAANQKMAAEITRDYTNKFPLVICILKGAVLFMTDIIREIDSQMEIDFMDVSSYGSATVSSGEVKILKDLDTSVTGRDVLIVEDIVDTGRTLNYLVDLFKYRKANSVKICTLLDKPERRVVDISPDYSGFIVPNEFVVGYGLDFDEKYRNLPYIGVLKPEIYSE